MNNAELCVVAPNFASLFRRQSIKECKLKLLSIGILGRRPTYRAKYGMSSYPSEPLPIL